VKLWLEKGREDLLVAEMVLGAPMHSYDIVSFHAQQAAEKSLKAVLIRYQVPFGKTHDIRQLLSLVEPVAPGLRARMSEAEALTPHAVASRYPGVEPGASRDEASRHLALARQVVDAVSALLKPYLDAGRPA
jgi:HEPN domain-containing protein